jgi:hypothetical protein
MVGAMEASKGAQREGEAVGEAATRRAAMPGSDFLWGGVLDSAPQQDHNAGQIRLDHTGHLLSCCACLLVEAILQ